jgi:pyruvate dehydrogenase E2 component (dihydrolipoamide acetyltransferase)
MAISVVMPALEMAQETGKLVSWRKKEGEAVAKGDVLLEIETDKAVMEIEAQGDGILAGVSVGEGDVVPVGQTIAWLVQPGEVPPPKLAPSTTTDVGGASTQSTAAWSMKQVGNSPSEVKASPKSRRLAQERGFDITQIRGSGPDGVITTDDVLKFATSMKSTSAADIEPLSSVARLMAERTSESWTTVPHFFLVRDFDATGLIRAREQLGPRVEANAGLRLTHTDLLIAAVARTLSKHPRMNGSWTPEGIRLNQEVNIGVAIAVRDAVVTGVIHKANLQPIEAIATQRHDLSGRAAAGRLGPADVTGATFTISNLGMYGIDSFSAIIVAPQAAILAVGQVADRVIAVDGQPVVRPTLTVTLSCDHRIIGGANAALFLRDLVETLISAGEALD